MSDLRPTLFLAQLSNLLAGNIAIVHGVTGSSRTFMGEEGAGVDAARIALARIAAGQSDIALIGGSHNCERKEMLMLYEFGDFNLRDKLRADLGAQRASRVLRSARSAPFWSSNPKRMRRARGAKPYARLTNVVADQARRKTPGEVTASLRSAVVETRQARRQWRHHHRRDRRRAGHVGGAGVSATSIRISRCGPPARRSATPWKRNSLSDWRLRRFRSRAEHCFRPTIRPALEVEMSKAPSQIVVVGAGHWRGEGMALVEAIK